ncbi:hypothetical protein PBRA_003775 [Plasmodiophora brassicae]|uniref:Uncharacterized protein n=1 Tax=Plasmodiophora brassicae TaxID=37360 RepID=A0A0G4IIM1_PLABS|nr:hypothetical protein PBRA_003775 [Plasmodiophora brassicae]
MGHRTHHRSRTGLARSRMRAPTDRSKYISIVINDDGHLPCTTLDTGPGAVFPRRHSLASSMDCNCNSVRERGDRSDTDLPQWRLGDEPSGREQRVLEYLPGRPSNVIAACPLLHIAQQVYVPPSSVRYRKHGTSE